jgi:hypothetical protein
MRGDRESIKGDRESMKGKERARGLIKREHEGG